MSSAVFVRCCTDRRSLQQLIRDAVAAAAAADPSKGIERQSLRILGCIRMRLTRDSKHSEDTYLFRRFNKKRHLLRRRDLHLLKFVTFSTAEPLIGHNPI